MIEKNRDAKTVIEVGAGYGELVELIVNLLTDVLGEGFCLSSWLIGATEVTVRRSFPLCEEDVEKIKASISDATAAFGPFKVRKEELKASMNGRKEGVSLHGEAINPLRSFLNIPLSVKEKPIGIINVASSSDRAFSQGEIALLQKVTSEASEALRFLWTSVTAERDRLQALVNNIIDGIILLDQTNRTILINPAAQKALGLRGRISSIGGLQKAKLREVPHLILKAIAGREEVCNRVVKSEDGRTILGVHIRAIKDKNGRNVGWMVVLRDITATWQIDKMKSEILSRTSRRLRSRLRSVKKDVDLIAGGELGEISEQQKTRLVLVGKTIEELYRFVGDFFDLSKLDMEDFVLDRRRTVNISILIDKVLESFTPQAQDKEINLANEVPASLSPIVSDRDKIVQVLNNLVDNAIKFTPRGGKVTVKARERKGDVLISIQDTGIGISETDWERIFQPFQRLNNSITKKIEGQGLGLSITKEIVQALGGRIWVESRVGHGSRFNFTLPRNRTI